MIPVYAGSFDPITKGHLRVIERVVKTFGACIVLVAVNPDKTPIFTPAERRDLINACLFGMGLSPAVHVNALVYNGYVADCYSPSSAFLVRGIRGEADLKQEMAIAEFNRNRTGIETVFIPSEPELSMVSSSQLKKMMEAGQPVGAYCTWPVEMALQQKLGGR